MQRFPDLLVFSLLLSLWGGASASPPVSTMSLPIQLHGQLITIPIESDSRLIVSDQALFARDKDHYISASIETLPPEQTTLTATEFVIALLSEKVPDLPEIQAARALMDRQIAERELLELSGGVAYFTRSADGVERVTYALSAEPNHYYLIETKGQDVKAVFNSLKINQK